MIRLSQLDELRDFGHVRRFTREHLEMQLGDVRAMLRLPLPHIGIHNGCNFAAASTLCALIAGFSEKLYFPPKGMRGSRDRFEGLLQAFFPWDEATADEERAVKASVLYRLVRNPLAHSLGVSNRKSDSVVVMKRRLRKREIDALEAACVQPEWQGMPAVLQVQDGWVLGVEELHASVIRLFKNLAGDREQMRRADAKFASGWH